MTPCSKSRATSKPSVLNKNVCEHMEPVTLIGLLFTVVLVVERLWKYTLVHVKRSKCCGSEVEFDKGGDDV